MMDLFEDIARTGRTAEPSRARWRDVYAREQAARTFDRAADAATDAPAPEPPHLHGEKRIILNAETTGLKWWDGDLPIGWSYRLPVSGRRGYLPIRHKRGANLPVERVHDWLRTELAGVHVDNANTRFDLHMSRADDVDLTEVACSFGDVAHDAALLDDSRQRFNLDLLALDVLGWDVSDDKLPPQVQHEGQFQELPHHLVAPYAIRNVDQVAQLLDVFEPQLEDEGLTDVRNLEREVIPVVVEMEKNGTYLDMPLLERWRAEVKTRIDDIKWTVYKATGVELTSFDSSKQLQLLFEKRGLPFTTFTATGAPSFTDGVMRAAERDPVIADVRFGGQLSDLDSKYLTKYWHAARPDGWLRYNLHQLRSQRDDEHAKGTVSGRFSAAGDRLGGYNPQQVVAVEKQLERGWCPDYVVRKLFIPGPGETAWFASDMAQVEYRLFAHYANDPKINAAYAADPRADFHALVMTLLHQVNPGLNRKLVKNINFALIYGAALIKFALMLGMITEAVFLELTALLRRSDFTVFRDARLAGANDLLQTYHRMFPRVKPLMDQTKAVAKQRGYVKTLLGRRARLADRFHSALNRIVQGGAADINKRALVEVHKQRKALGFVPRLTVHDEVCGGLLPGANVAALDTVLNTQYFDLRVPILWDSKTGPNWAACK